LPYPRPFRDDADRPPYRQSVIRTIVQLSEEQHAALRELARSRGTSVAALVREGVDGLLEARDERRRRRVAAIEP